MRVSCVHFEPNIALKGRGPTRTQSALLQGGRHFLDTRPPALFRAHSTLRRQHAAIELHHHGAETALIVLRQSRQGSTRRIRRLHGIHRLCISPNVASNGHVLPTCQGMLHVRGHRAIVCGWGHRKILQGVGSCFGYDATIQIWGYI